jgi:acyl carrier protein
MTSIQTGSGSPASADLEHFGRFERAFRARFELDDSQPLTAETTLFDELCFDSFDALRLIVFVEEFSEVVFAPLRVPEMWTVGDAYGYHLQLCDTAETTT